MFVAFKLYINVNSIFSSVLCLQMLPTLRRYSTLLAHVLNDILHECFCDLFFRQLDTFSLSKRNDSLSSLLLFENLQNTL